MATEDKKNEATASLLQPEANDNGEEVPQDPYSHNHDTMASRYSTLRADDLETMLNGGLERFYKKYDHLSRKINLQLPTPRCASRTSHGTVGTHLASIFTPWEKIPMTTKHALHPMSGIIKPGSMTLILANPGAGKSTFLKALAGKLQDNKQTEIGERSYSGLRGDEIDLVKLTFKFADMCVNGRPEDQPEEMRDIAALRTELFLQILGLENCADTVWGERKRVTVGEVLVGGQSLSCVTRSPRVWIVPPPSTSSRLFVLVQDSGVVIVALLQPTPEVVEQFDDILMVNEGHMVYHGPETEILDYFQGLGFMTSGRGHGYSNGKSSIYKKTHEAISKGFNEHQFESPEDFKKAKSVANLARSKEKSEFGLAFVPSTMCCEPPEAHLLFEALIVGLVLGMIYFNVSSTLRKVFYKQRPRNFFRTTSYAIAESVVQIPVNLVVSFILGTFFYFMSGLTRTFEKYMCSSSCSCTGCHLCELLPPVLGNIILADLIPDYWIWMYWFSPVSWALRSNMLSEFSSDRYTPLLDLQGTEFIWFGIVVLLAYYFLFTTLNGMALHYIRYEKYKGVSVKPLTDKASDEDNVYVEVDTPGAGATKSGNGGGLPFTPSNLCIKDLEYFKQLLRGITATSSLVAWWRSWAATGGGKTTLMDVIAGSHHGVCEQMDIHSEAATIYEAPGVLCQPASSPNFTKEQRMNLVHETLDLLELTAISGAMVGGLSVEQKKRNPSVLFLDEPTSGLDARSALIVMRGVQSIARTGRTVLCTIHQPSISIFELFDGLLLLQRGGYTAYFGDLGVDSVKMLEYFASIPGTMEIRPQYNPATYMLEVIGAGIGRDVKDYSVEYKNSELYKSNRDPTLCASTLNYTPIATGFWNQLKELAKKQQLTYWRNPQYNFMRMFLFPLFGVIFGTTFYQLEADSVKRINSHIGLIYNSMDFIGVINLMTVLEVTCAERAVFYRERMSKLRSTAYSLSLWFAEVPDNGGDFLFFIVFYLYTSACTYVGQWMSALMPNEKVANVAAGYKWFTYLMPSSYSLSALVGGPVRRGPGRLLCDGGRVTTDMTVAQYIEDTYDFRPNRKYNFMAGLMVIWVVLQLAIYLTFKYVSHLKR
ncbi:P-loop containing nucleoside triphosphate hydrolase [Phytophthora cactorum]|nr:P-loop containing nucleoside triphosphate hydrolase [Phytophthora cactorum]